MSSGDFDFLHGTWTVRHAYLRERLTGCQDWQHFEGTADCSPLPGGSGNVDCLTMSARGLRGYTFRLFDPETDTWALHWTTSTSRAFEPAVVGGFEEGTGCFEGDDHHHGTAIRVRYVWDDISERTARWQQLFSVDAGRTWELNWMMRFARADRGFVHDRMRGDPAQEVSR